MQRGNSTQRLGKDRGKAYYVIGEIEQTLRLIDMAFYPFKKQISKTISELDVTSKKTFELVVKENYVNESKVVAQ